MSTLYIDCDDTLVRWRDEEPGKLVTEWEANHDVINYAERWRGRVVVWSSGGQEYAAMWGQRLLNHVPHTAMCKEPVALLAGDVLIDDDPWPEWAAHRVLDPDAMPSTNRIEREEE